MMSQTLAPEADALTIFINHPSADHFRSMLEAKFPTMRVLVGHTQEAIDRFLPQADVMLAFKFPAADFSKAKKLRWYQSTAAGVDAAVAIRERLGDLIVTNARGIHGEMIADYVMAGITMLHWDFPDLLKQQQRRKWTRQFATPLSEHTVGIVGLGSIGSTIARRAKSAGMTVLGMKRETSRPINNVDQLFSPSDLDNMLPQCDFVVLAVPATPETVGLIAGPRLRKMRRSAYLVNIARGNVVVEKDLIEALESGTIAGAMLDVFETEPLPEVSPLWTMPKVIVTPHMSGTTADYASRVFKIFEDNLQRFIEERPLKNVVDLSRGY